jgi:uncharacterized protein (TIGR04222 family)
MTPTFAITDADTWGVSGPDFLKAYIGLAAGLSVLAAVLFLWTYYRHSFSNQDTRAVGERLSSADAAYLRGGRAAAVLSALAGLRARGLVLATGRHRLATSRARVPGEASALERAVHEAVRHHAPYRRIAHASAVRQELDTVEARLTELGLVRPVPHRAALRGVELAVLATLAVGIARLAAGIGNQKPVGYLILTLIGLASVLVWFHFLIRRFPNTRFGDRVLAHLNSRYVHLGPSHRPSWQANGAETAAMSAALFGAAAVYASDPAFAARLGVSLSATTSGYTNSGGYSGAGSTGGCGSSGDSGGGGGCGGGGCGG